MDANREPSNSDQGTRAHRIGSVMKSPLARWSGVAVLSAGATVAGFRAFGINQGGTAKQPDPIAAQHELEALRVPEQSVAPSVSVRPSRRWDKEVSLPWVPPGFPPIKLAYAEDTVPNAGGGIARDPMERGIFMAPLFLVERTKDGELNAKVTEDGTLILPVVVYDSTGALGQAAFSMLHESLPSGQQRLAGRMLTYTPEAITFDDTFGDTSSPVSFRPWRTHVLSSGTGRIDLVGKFTTKAAAEAFLTDFEQGARAIDASMVYPGVRHREASVALSFEDVAGTELFRDLSGKGDGTVTRRDVARLVAEGLKRAHITIVRDEDYQNNKDLDRLIDALLAQLPKEEARIASARASLDEAFHRIGVDPQDLRADIMTRYKVHKGDQGEDYRKFQSELERQMKAKRSSSGFDLGAFKSNGGSSEEESKEIKKILIETLRKWNISFDEEKDGTFIAVKSIDVYQNEFSRWSDMGSLAFGDRTRLVGEGVLCVQINRHNIVHGFDAVPLVVREGVEKYLRALQSYDAVPNQFEADMGHYEATIKERQSIVDTLSRTHVLRGVGRNRSSEQSGSWAGLHLDPERCRAREDTIVGFVTYYGKRAHNIALLVRRADGSEYQTEQLLPGASPKDGRCESSMRISQAEEDRGAVITGVECFYEGDDFDGWTFNTTFGQIHARLGGGRNTTKFPMPSLPEGFQWELIGVQVEGKVFNLKVFSRPKFENIPVLDHANLTFQAAFIDPNREIPAMPQKPAKRDRPVLGQ